MTIMQVGIVACLGWRDSSGKSAVKPREDSSEKILSRRGLIKGKGIKVILTMGPPIENDTNK